MVTIGTMDKLKVVATPVLLAITLGIGYMLVRSQLNFWIQGDEGAMTSGTIAVFGMLWAIVGGFAVFEVLRQWNTVFEAYKTRNKVKYEENVDKRLPWHLKASWGATSIFLWLSFVLTYWKNDLTAFFAVAGVAFVMLFWWQVAMDLDDYSTGVWNIPLISKGYWKSKK